MLATPPDSPGQCEPGLSDHRPQDPRLLRARGGLRGDVPRLRPRAEGEEAKAAENGGEKEQEQEIKQITVDLKVADLDKYL